MTALAGLRVLPGSAHSHQMDALPALVQARPISGASLPLVPGCPHPIRPSTWQGGEGVPLGPVSSCEVKGLLTRPTFSPSVKGWRWNQSLLGSQDAACPDLFA